MIADILSRPGTNDYYIHNELLNNTEPSKLEKKEEVNMIITQARAADQEYIKPKLPELQIKVQNIFKFQQETIDEECGSDS